MPPLTPQETRVLSLIAPLEAKLGRRPFQQEIALAAGLKSKACANKYLNRLEAKGYLDRDYEGKHTLRVRSVDADAAGYLAAS